MTPHRHSRESLLIVGSETKTLAESLRDERRAVHATWDTPDQRAGIGAFLQKRQPIFNRSLTQS
ncbi:MAG TPA: hypothetical protein VMS22_02160 [Candidatus Eisenbacteria bacterium]|nr:hypothetical protein [Candidatus Eisenbacteria bacterium]